MILNSTPQILQSSYLSLSKSRWTGNAVRSAKTRTSKPHSRQFYIQKKDLHVVSPSKKTKLLSDFVVALVGFDISLKTSSREGTPDEKMAVALRQQIRALKRDQRDSRKEKKSERRLGHKIGRDGKGEEERDYEDYGTEE